eukprot:GHRR01008608.1.p1 GENE.GHRR01008608.1~~GHRR01008608.1.p1  ORF type:complete len:137 (+),score=42.55 GHRR01008608.1:1428-1838(+)
MASGWMIAAAGWMFAWFNSKTQEERKARIERVNEQLRDFYGPLLACVTATKSAYDAMVKQHSPNGSAAAFQERCIHDPTGPEAKAYRQVHCSSIKIQDSNTFSTYCYADVTSCCSMFQMEAKQCSMSMYGHYHHRA